MSSPDPAVLQSLCEEGQRLLIATDYHAAEEALLRAEQLAVALNDYDTLGRLYMPLQEARRQQRQRCGEGIIRLDLIAAGWDDPAIDPHRIAEQYPQGQLLVAGFGSLEPAVQLRAIQHERRQFAETFLAAVYPVSEDGSARAVVIAPLAEVRLPEPTPRSIDALLRLLPPHAIVMAEAQLPRGEQPGTPQTYAYTMGLWEQLYAPYLAVADSEPNPLRRIEAYRQAIRVDHACEFAHQRLSDTARAYARTLGS